MHGKKKCKILKEIRKQIAKDNDITYITTECKHQGNCKGTCPKCEAEVRYLEAELEKRRMAGKQVVVAGIAATMLLTASCTPEPQDISSASSQAESAESVYSETVDGLMEPPSEEVTATMGELAPESSEEEFWEGEVPEESSEEELVPGGVPGPEESSDEVELGGDPLPWPEEN